MPSPIPYSATDLTNVQDLDPQSVSTANARAAHHLRCKNKKKKKSFLVIPGDISLAAGQVVTLSGFGIFDGSWIIERLRHKIGRSSGFTTELELRHCLDY